MNKEFPHKCLHAQCKHCLEFVPIYDHQCYITSEEEKQFKRQLQQFRRRKNKTEAILGMVAEGLPDVSTQLVIDELVTKRKKKLKESTVGYRWLKSKHKRTKKDWTTCEKK